MTQRSFRRWLIHYMKLPGLAGNSRQSRRSESFEKPASSSSNNKKRTQFIIFFLQRSQQRKKGSSLLFCVVSDPNFDIPFASSNVTLLSYRKKPRKKRTKIANNDIGSSSSRPKPVKKPDPDAPKIAGPCTECGKQFSSLKALFGHMRCHPERQWRGINPPLNHIRETSATAISSSSSLNWVSDTSEKDQVGASCLLMLANGGSTDSSGGCKNVIGSPQALGEHRATHKHVERCLAVTNLTEDPPPPPPHLPPQEIVDQDKSKGVELVSGMNHLCNICFRVFSSCHMRCHCEKDQEENQVGPIDLNVPATTSSDTSLGCSLELRL